MTCHTPSIPDMMSALLNRITQYPCRSSQSVRLSSRAWSLCVSPSTSMTSFASRAAKSAM